MMNPRLDLLADYPFDRLRALLDGLPPPKELETLVLSVGEPRHSPSPLVHEVIAANSGLWGRYPPIDGTPEFRLAVTDWLNRRYALPDGLVDAHKHVLPVAGTREALYLIASVAIAERRAGSRPAVLMPNPFYQVYYGAAVMSGAEPCYLAATPETGHLPDLTQLDDAALERTAIMYLCSPANPQGAAADGGYLENAIRLARRFDFVLVVDECYGDIYDRQPPCGALQACAAMSDGSGGEDMANVLVFHSLSKRSSVPGLRSGFVAGDPRLISAFRRVRSFGGASVPLPVLAASAALWKDTDYPEHNRALYREKFDAAEAILANRFGFYRPEGGFFLWLDVGNGEEAAKKLWAEGALRVLPGAYLAKSDAFGANPGANYIRMALIDDLPSTQEALRRLDKIL